jgi:glycogen synthase
MPMTASCYGAIPIVTLNGGLSDNFNEDNAIVVDDNGLSDAISRAAALYADKDALMTKRKVCMDQDFSWTTRKAEYIELYEE